MEFARGHVFTYSPRPGTAAESFPGQVPNHLAKQRNAEMREIVGVSSSRYQEKHFGQVLSVLWETATPLKDGQWQLGGLSDNYLHINTISPSPCYNQIMQVKLIGMERGELLGKII